MPGNGNKATARKSRLFRGVATAAVLAGLAVPTLPGAGAAQRMASRIDSFGPYRLGMTPSQAMAADKGSKQGECGEIAAERQCLILNAAVFEEPAVIYGVLDPAAAKIERIVVQFDPQLTRRRAYRCVRLSEKVFALLAVVYGARYKQSYDESRRPLPAVAWDGDEAGRLVFETRCRTQDEGTPRISVIEYYPNGVKPPPVASQEKVEPKAAAPKTVDATGAMGNVPLSVENRGVEPRGSAGKPAGLALASPGGEAPVPLRVPIGVVEEIKPGAPDTSGAVDANTAMATLTRELAYAKGKVQPDTAPAAAPIAAAPEAPAPVAAVTPEPPQAAVAARPETPASPVSAATPEQPAPDEKYKGRYTVPVDIAMPDAAPSPADPARSDPPAIARSTGTPPAADPTAAAPAKSGLPAVPVADPGPVTLPASPPTLAASVPARPEAASVASAREAVASVRPVPDYKTAFPESPQRPAEPGRRPSLTEVPAPAAPAAMPGAAPAAAPVTAAGAAGPAIRPAAPAVQTAALTPQVRPPSYREADELPVPSDLEAPEPFMVEEEEDIFRLRREEPETRQDSAAAHTLESEVQRRLATASAAPVISMPAADAPRSMAAGKRAADAPISLLSVTRTEQVRSDADRAADPAPVSAPESGPGPARQATTTAASKTPALPVPPTAAAPPRPAPSEKATADAPARDVIAGSRGKAGKRGFAPVLSGGWRHRAPVPPAKPWREREAVSEGEGATDAPGSGA